MVILGAGSVGCYLGGCLAAAGHSVTLIGRARIGKQIAQHGLTVTDWRGRHEQISPEQVNYTETLSPLATARCILLCVKSQDSETAAQQIREYAPLDCPVVSFQNGVANGPLLASLLDQPVYPGMVPFNVVSKGNGHFHCGTEGSLALADPFDQLSSLTDALQRANLPVNRVADLTAIQYGKLLLNLNNAVNALSGMALKQQLENRQLRRVMAAVLKEALQVMKHAKIKPARSGKVVPGLLPLILSLPDGLFRRIAGSMLKIDPQARSSMYEDLYFRRPTEVAYLNGEIVRLGQQFQQPTPINQALVELVEAAQQRAQGSPNLSPETLSKLLKIV